MNKGNLSAKAASAGAYKGSQGEQGSFKYCSEGNTCIAQTRIGLYIDVYQFYI